MASGSSPSPAPRGALPKMHGDCSSQPAPSVTLRAIRTWGSTGGWALDAWVTTEASRAVPSGRNRRLHNAAVERGLRRLLEVQAVIEDLHLLHIPGVVIDERQEGIAGSVLSAPYWNLLDVQPTMLAIVVTRNTLPGVEVAVAAWTLWGGHDAVKLPG